MTPAEIIANTIQECQFDPLAMSVKSGASEILEALSDAGFVVVPKEPTRAMLDAALAEWQERVRSKTARGAFGEHGPEHPIRENYRVMLGAVGQHRPGGKDAV